MSICARVWFENEFDITKLGGRSRSRDCHLAIGSDVIQTDRKLDRASAKLLMLRLSADPRVTHVEIDALRQPTSLPNDSYGAAYQWQLFDAAAGIDLPSSWGQSSGNGVVVAVLDTGTTLHSDLSSHYLRGYDFISDGAIARDGDGRDADPSDMGDWTLAGECSASNPGAKSSWHGTHVAGTIAALTGNGKGTAGVAPGANILPLRVLGKCGGYDSDIADAIVWAAGGKVPGVPMNANPAEVINLSLGSPGACEAGSALQTAINSAVKAGTVVAAAAGNENANAAAFSPASCSNVITVGAVGRSGARASYSNHGANVDVSAPGGDHGEFVYSTYNAGATSPGAEGYAGLQGTSMAAPLVSGVVALMQSLNVNTPAMVKVFLRKSARPFPTTCDGCGSGIVDAAAALRAAKGTNAAAVPTLSIADAALVREGASGTTAKATFKVSLSQASTQAVAFTVATSGGTATAGGDYVALSPTVVTMPAGQTSMNVSVTINGDNVQEADETFFVHVTGVTGATVVRGDAVGTIADDDMTLSVNDISVTEGNSGTKLATFAVSLSRASLMPVTFNLRTGAGGTATAGVDYVAVPTTRQTIPAGQTSMTYSVTVNGDTTVEPNETFQLIASSAVGAVDVKGVAIGTIVNDDSTAISIGDASVAEGNSGTTSMTVTVSLSQPSSVPVTFHIATADGTAKAGSDYLAVPYTALTIPAGTTSMPFNITINGDTTFEPNETFVVNLSGVTGASIARSQGTGTIVNDDAMPSLSVNNIAVFEGNRGTTQATFTVSLSAPSGSNVTYNVATADGTAITNDYVPVASTPQTIPAGAISKTFSVTVNGDTTVEPDETFTLNLSNAAGATIATAHGIATIQNDDYPTLSVSDASVVEGNSGTTMMNFTITLSQPTPWPVTYSVSTADQYAKSGSDFAATTANGTFYPGGATTATISVPVYGDTLVEGNEAFILYFTANSGATVARSQGYGTIIDDDFPTVWGGNPNIIDYDPGIFQVNYTGSLSSPAPYDIYLHVTTKDGTAVSQIYYIPYDGDVYIPAGQTQWTVPISIVGYAACRYNMYGQPFATFYVNATPLNNNAIAGSPGSITITDPYC